MFFQKWINRLGWWLVEFYHPGARAFYYRKQKETYLTMDEFLAEPYFRKENEAAPLYGGREKVKADAARGWTADPLSPESD